MSTENIYLSVVRWLDGGGSRTDIMKFSYDEGKITGKAAGSVNGYVNSSFSMNEWNGYLRMVVEQYNDTYSNALYILDETMEICGSTVERCVPREKPCSPSAFGGHRLFCHL